MRLLHLSDLHVGKRVCETDLAEDQRQILGQILKISDRVRPDAVLVAGDLYDRSVPPGEAVSQLGAFLTDFASRGTPVLAISGNHDSPERLDFGSRIMRRNGVAIAGVFRGRMETITLRDAFGAVNFYLLPFLRPACVEPFFPQKAETTEQAVRAVLSAQPVDPKVRNVLVAHQFVVNGDRGPAVSGSETLSVGGSDKVDASLFSAFDYVALGHLHGAQSIGRPEVRYCGSPLKYSFAESRQSKSVTVVELEEKGRVRISAEPLTPQHDMREIRGPITELIRPEIASLGNAQDYIRAVLTDEREVSDAVGRLRAVYPNLMQIDFESARELSAQPSKSAASGDVAHRTPGELFEEFYRNQSGAELPENERAEFEQAVKAAQKEAEP